MRFCASVWTIESFCSWSAAAQDFARAAVPDTIFRSFMLASMTALNKRDGGVRGIATGTVFRRLVAKTLARQFSKEVEDACAPFQFALSTRAGVDCVGHAVRVVTLTQTTQRQFCLRTALEFTTMCLERQCCQNSWKFPDCANCCLSCARRTQPHLVTSGLTLKDTRTRFGSMRGRARRSPHATSVQFGHSQRAR